MKKTKEPRMKAKTPVILVESAFVYYELRQRAWDAYYAAHKEEIEAAENERRMANLYRILPGLIRKD